MSEFANSNNQAASLKANYKDDEIQRLADGGVVEMPEPEGLDEFLASADGSDKLPPPEAAYADGGVVPPSDAEPAGLDALLGGNPQPQAQSSMAGQPEASNDEPAGLDDLMLQHAHGSGLEQLKAFGEGAAQGVLGPLAPVAEQAASQALFNQSPEQTQENIRAREEANPIAHTAGMVTGLTGSMMTGVGEGAIAANLGEHVAGALVPQASTTLAKIGSRAVSDAIANMTISGGDELTKHVLNDPNSIETSVANIGLSGLIGGVIGGGLKGGTELWNATLGPKAAEALHYVSNRLGGVEGQTPSAINEAIEKSGIDFPPEQKAVLSGDSLAQSTMTSLLDSTGKSGKATADALADTHSKLADEMIGSLGRDPSKAIPTEYSKYDAGKNIGDTLASEYKEQIDPIAKAYGRTDERLAKVELRPDTEVQGPSDNSNPYNPKPGAITRSPGTISEASDKIAQLAVDNGWTTSPSSDIMREVNRTLKELPLQKTLGDLSNYIKQVGANTYDALNPELSRAGGMMKSILREAEGNTMLAHLGETEGPQAIADFQASRAAYAKQAALKDTLDDYLHIRGSTASYHKGIADMANTNAEQLLNKISGKNNAHLLEFLGENYPKTLQAIKDSHLEQILAKAAEKAPEGSKISVASLNDQLAKLSPELRNLVAPPAQMARIEGLSKLVDGLNPKNFTSGKIANLLNKHITGAGATATAFAAGVMAHNPIAALAVGTIAHVFSDTPNIARLGLLKFMGSSAEVNAPAFKSMLNTMASIAKGEATMSKAVKNIFKAEGEVLPLSAHPTENDRVKLQKHLDSIQSNPQSLMNGTNDTAHYMPDHASAQSETVARASSYLNSIKPATTKASPLDTPIPPTADQKANYNNALNIAIQPLIVANKIKAGTATPQDVATLKAMYPNLYNTLAQKITAEMSEAITKGNSIPYKTRLGMTQFLGQPMDSTMTPANILAAQPQASQPTTPGEQPGQKAPHKNTDLSKTANAYLTPDQARQKRMDK